MKKAKVKSKSNISELGTGNWELDAGYWILDAGYRITEDLCPPYQRGVL
jgi:hypothetical protein